MTDRPVAINADPSVPHFGTAAAWPAMPTGTLTGIATVAALEMDGSEGVAFRRVSRDGGTRDDLLFVDPG